LGLGTAPLGGLFRETEEGAAVETMEQATCSLKGGDNLFLELA
jgi:hypothetical protein